MPKRKRPDDAEEILDKIEDRALRIKASRLKARIDQGNKSLKDALQLARGFERQKLGRRQKKASHEPHTLLRLREEVIVLKELDVTKAASDYLFKQLARTTRIRKSPSFVALFGHDVKTEAPKSTAEANVLGRLFKANPVKEVLPGIMDGMRQVLSLDDSKSSASSVEKAAPRVAEETRKASEVNSESAKEKDERSARTSQEMGDGGEEDDINFDAYDNRLAGSSDESGDEPDTGLDPMEISEDEHDDRSPTDELDTVSPSESELSESMASASPLNQNKPDQRMPSSSFLPSLSMGGYYSGSESDNGDDLDNQVRGPAIPKPRKNRRGQRERQKLAELKFGKNAKHLQKQGQSNDSRNAGWDAKRGAVESKGHDPRQQRRFGKGFSVGRTTNGSTGGNRDAGVNDRSRQRHTGQNAKKNDGPLHPSWEAAKKRKQESNAAFAGTKINFD